MAAIDRHKTFNADQLFYVVGIWEIFLLHFNLAIFIVSYKPLNPATVGLLLLIAILFYFGISLEQAKQGSFSVVSTRTVCILWLDSERWTCILWEDGHLWVI